MRNLLINFIILGPFPVRLSTSIKDENDGTEKYKCDICNSQYSYMQGLWKHKKYYCNVQPQFHCEACKRTFRQKSHLSYHLRACKVMKLFVHNRQKDINK